MKPHLTFAGYSGSGKTTLAEKVIQCLSEKGIKVYALKHDGHSFQMDKEGKDTHRLKQAGAIGIAIASSDKFALINDCDHRLSFQEMMHFAPKSTDIIIGEGFKDDIVPKILVHRKDNNKPSLFSSEKNIIAVITDDKELFNEADIIFDINDYKSVAEFIENYIKNFKQ